MPLLPSTASNKTQLSLEPADHQKAHVANSKPVATYSTTAQVTCSLKTILFHTVRAMTATQINQWDILTSSIHNSYFSSLRSSVSLGASLHSVHKTAWQKRELFPRILMSFGKELSQGTKAFRYMYQHAVLQEKQNAGSQGPGILSIREPQSACPKKLQVPVVPPLAGSQKVLTAPKSTLAGPVIAYKQVWASLMRFLTFIFLQRCINQYPPLKPLSTDLWLTFTCLHTKEGPNI